MSPIVHKPPIVANTQSGVELLRQKLQRMREWNCPALTQDPGFGQMPPGMLWIRTDMVGCERYRFYDENGNVVTLCDDGAGGDTNDDSVILVKSFAASDSDVDEIVNTTAETTFATTYTIPANTVAVGDLFRFRIQGTTRVDPVNNANFRLKIYFETVTLFDSQNLTLISPNTNMPWYFDFDMVIHELNEFGDFSGGGMAAIGYGSAIAPTYLIRPWNNGSGVGWSISTGVDGTISVTCKWDTADLENEARLTLFTVLKGRVGGGL